MTTDQWLNNAIKKLAHAGVELPQMEARAILESALEISREKLVASDFEFEPNNADDLLARRLELEPLAYILGFKEFYGRDFRVDRRVLIPRPETETLIQCIVEAARTGMRCVDVGTGSGCVGITAQLELPETQWTCTEFSPDALAVARHNATELDANVDIVQCDLLEPFAPLSFDLIASNPPYVAEGDARLNPDVERWEPKGALFAGTDGFSVFRRLIEQAQNVLKPGGRLILECGKGQARGLVDLLDGWNPTTVRDLAGTERVVVATKPSSG